jgi:hypothetical protein
MVDLAKDANLFWFILYQSCSIQHWEHHTIILHLSLKFHEFKMFLHFFLTWKLACRLENEHLNNVGKFRAVKEVPLPFREMDSD